MGDGRATEEEPRESLETEREGHRHGEKDKTLR